MPDRSVEAIVREDYMSTSANSDTSTVAWEPWIQTVTGRKFHFLGGGVDEVHIDDIATALSRQPRWAGHTADFYSVAQHSVEVKNLVAERGGNHDDQLHALLHDATEAYMCDIPSPLKRLIPEFRRIEGEVWDKISRRFFGVGREMPAIVHDADLAMLATEARDLLAFKPVDNWTDACPPPWAKTLSPLSQSDAYTHFVAAFDSLN